MSRMFPQFTRRLRGWRFLLLNLVLGMGHMVVLFNGGSYVALLPHAASDLGGVSPSFGASCTVRPSLVSTRPELSRWKSPNW